MYAGVASSAAENKQEMTRIIECWAMAEKRAKHLCAFQTLGLNVRCRKPTREEVKKAWHRLCARLHPDKNSDCNELATDATGCLNLAKDHLFEDFFGDAAARVSHKHTHEAAEAAKAAAEATEAAAAAADATESSDAAHAAPAEAPEPSAGLSSGEAPPDSSASSGKRPASEASSSAAEESDEQPTKRQRDAASSEDEVVP